MALNSWQKITRVLPGMPFGTGADGAYSSATIPTLINLSCSGTATSTSFTVSSTTLANGNLILIHQSRGTGAGQWEINRVSSGGGTTSLTLQTALQYTYTDSGASQAQVIKIPQYTTVTQSGTWTVPTWDGNIGSLFFFAAKTSSSITSNFVMSNSFAGGIAVGRNTNGYQGEGTGGAGSQTNGSNGNGGGGGIGGADAGSGGGGANGSGGGTGTAQSGHAGGTGGSSVGTTTLTEMDFGGAGGSGGGDEDGDQSGYGGRGGGIIGFFSKSVEITGTINVNGNAGHSGVQSGGEGMGAGGGGAGGSVLICGQTVVLGSDKITALGGAGGIGVRRPSTIGGAGGNGRVAVYYSGTVSGTTSLTATLTSEQDGSLMETGGGFLFNLV